jgi:hypothetical protein
MRKSFLLENHRFKLLKYYHDRKIKIVIVLDYYLECTTIRVYELGWNGWSVFDSIWGNDPESVSILSHVEDFDRIMKFFQSRKSRKVAGRWFIREARKLEVVPGIKIGDILKPGGDRIDWDCELVGETNVRAVLWTRVE